MDEPKKTPFARLVLDAMQAAWDEQEADSEQARAEQADSGPWTAADGGHWR